MALVPALALAAEAEVVFFNGKIITLDAAAPRPARWRWPEAAG
jgi:hypothetical protein